MSGHRCFQLFLIYHLLVNGVGYKEQMQAEKLNGQHFQRLRKPVLNYFNVDARKSAGRSVGVSKLLYNVLFCALVMGYAIVTSIKSLLPAQTILIQGFIKSLHLHSVDFT